MVSGDYVYNTVKEEMYTLDIWSLGVMLYFLVSRKVPFGSTMFRNDPVRTDDILCGAYTPFDDRKNKRAFETVDDNIKGAAFLVSCAHASHMCHVQHDLCVVS